MADNTQLDESTTVGDKIATVELSFSGDTTKFQIVGNTILVGSEGSWSQTLLVGGAGAVTGGVQRMTLASDDPAVVALQIIDNAISGNEMLIAGGATQASDVKVTMDGESVAVTGTFFQATQPVSAASLPLPSGAATSANQGTGNTALAAIQASVEIMDDWDESDRAKVNLIVGQAGVAAGAGVVGVTVPRVTLASDDPGVTHLGTLAGAVDGTEMQVDVVAALPAGDNNIGNVDVLTVGSVIDANNSTTTPLGGGAVFTGTGTDMLGYSAVTVALASDVDSAVDGMTFQFSTDDTNWDDIYEFTFDFSECPARRFQFPATARYFRVVYTNGGGAQSTFRVQTILHTATPLTSIHRLVDEMDPDRSATVVKSVLFAQAAGSGAFMAINATAGGNLKVSIEETNGAATFPVEGLAAEDAAVVGDPVLSGGRFDTSARSLDDGDVGALALTPEAAAFVAAGAQSSFAYDGNAKRTVGHFHVVTSTSGAEVIPTPGASLRLRILSLSVIATTTTETEAYFETGTSGTDAFGTAAGPLKVSIDADGDNFPGLALDHNPHGWFETADANEALDVILSSAQTVIITGTYMAVTD